MPCFRPVTAYHLVNQEGRRDGVSFKPAPGAHELSLPCGRCVGCRLERADQWATRVMHEAQLHDANCFITLTYDDNHLPHDGGLRYPDYQRFMKRLRKRFGPVRFYACGEYGDRLKRPHYHAALFGIEFPDLEHIQTNNGHKYFRSPALDQLWPEGMHTIGELTRESANYIARYVLKKQAKGPLLNQNFHYTRVDPDTGEIFDVSPEFTRMSLKPGIGAKWLEAYHADVYPQDRINSQGRFSKVPRYYDQQMEVINPDILTTVREQRYRRALLTSEDNTQARLTNKEQAVLHNNKQRSRSLE